MSLKYHRRSETFCVSLRVQKKKTHLRRNLHQKSSERYLGAVFARLDALNWLNVEPWLWEIRSANRQLTPFLRQGTSPKISKKEFTLRLESTGHESCPSCHQKQRVLISGCKRQVKKKLARISFSAMLAATIYRTNSKSMNHSDISMN